MNKEFFIYNAIGQETANKLASFFNGDLKSNYGENLISFNNEFGKGKIRVVSFDYGMSLLSYDVNFLQDTTIQILYKDPVPIDFLFLTSGKVSFKADKTKEICLESYQNVIVRYKLDTATTYKMKAGDLIRLNIIQICPNLYLEKNDHQVELLQPDIKRIFLTKDTSQIYHHFGNFNLKIADYVRQLNYCDYNGMIRSLIIEGCLNIILALQLAEHENFAENKKLPESLSKGDIVKIQKAAEIIQEHIHENLSVGRLAIMVQLTQARLQIGFKFLYQKTVNNYTKEIKLQAAHNYLMNSNLTVSEVVYKVGYSSRSYFTEIFFERFGILPNQYKKNFK